MKPAKRRILLLDADIMAYKIASGAQQTFQFPDCEPYVMTDDWSEVTPRIDALVNEYVTALNADEAWVCLSCPTVECFRLDVLPTYKGTRAGIAKPLLLVQVKDYMESNWKSYRRPRLEADDIMGILSTSSPKNEQRIIVSEDKDMQTIPGWLWNPSKDTKPRLISEADADRYHMYQTITGDTVDGYTGCPGAGPKAADDILVGGMVWQSYEHTYRSSASGSRAGTTEIRWAKVGNEMFPPTTWESVVSLYNKFGLTEADALVQARVARILRSIDFNFNTKEPILWNPPK